MLSEANQANHKKLSRDNFLMEQITGSHNVAFRLHTHPSEEIERVRSNIADKYFAVHQAKLTKFMPQIIEMYNGKTVYGGVGLRSGDSGEFYLEQYLGSPLEQVIATLANTPIDRSTIVEIGNFAVLKKGLGSLFITVLAKALEQAGFQWMVFTATTEVTQIINRLGCVPIKLADANSANLEQDDGLWGDYYATKPVVMACNLRDTINNASSKTSFVRLFDCYTEQISSLVSEMTVKRTALIN